MRRKDREVTDVAMIEEIINSCDCCRLGLVEADEVYIVPLNFAYDKKQNAFYFHCAKEGRKIDLIRKTGKAGFELDTNHKLQEGNVACSYSFQYQSVIGTGKVQIVEDAEERKAAFALFMEHYTGKNDWIFDEKVLEAAAIIKLEVEKMSCKENNAEKGRIRESAIKIRQPR